MKCTQEVRKQNTKIKIIKNTIQMKPKTKAILYNLVAFMSLFLAFRFTLGYIIPVSGLWLSLICAVLASVIAPKFAAVEQGGKERVLMRSFFSKDSKEV